MKVHVALQQFAIAYDKARMKHRPMHSSHEGYAVLLEEVDELWDAVKRDDYQAMKEEAVHIGAMAAAFLAEVFDEKGWKKI